MTGQAKARGISALPTGYLLHQTIDIKSERKFQLATQSFFLLIVLAAGTAALVFALPLTSGWSLWGTIAVTAISVLVYMAVHEATHGVAIHVLTGIRPFYGMAFPFLTTGSRAYLSHRSFVIAALAPCIVWGAVLLAAWFLLPADFRLTAYVVLTLNFAGSAGDFVLIGAVRGQPAGALVQDDGAKVRIFVPREPGHTVDPGHSTPGQQGP